MNTPFVFKISVGMIVLSLLLSACGPSASVAESNPAPVAKSDLARVSSPVTAPDEIRGLVEKDNEFAFDLYRSLQAQDGNLIYSPYSISLALAMTYAGARGETESQMARAMHFLPQDNIHPALAILENLQPASLQLTLPKFEFKREFGLADRLAALGMKDAFDPDRADFSGMTEKKDLYISAVLHKAFIAVDENGTEAAAATAVSVAMNSMPVSVDTLKIDRPFIFLIRDIPSGQILFIGRALNPAS